MADEMCDVLIVGGGPAGSTCARQLSNAGLDVGLIDKMDFPRTKPCAGWITPPVVDLLQVDPTDYRGDRVWQPITGFRSGILGGRQVTVEYEQPISYGIRRCEFDTYLLHRSAARLQLGQRVADIRREGPRWRINDRWTAAMLVGAGGHFCPVARLLGARQKVARSVVYAQEVEFPLPPGQQERVAIRPEVPELFFCNDLAGYGWCFRKQDYLNIGLGRVGAKDLSVHVTKLCEFLKSEGKVSCQMPGRFHGHAYQICDRADVDPFDDGVMLVGDAAGLAYPLSGEGIRPAVESGLLAAEVILQAEGDYRRERLAAYGRQLTERFGQHRLQSVLDHLPVAWLARATATHLFASRWFTRHVVMNGWFLHRRQSPLEAVR
jgi:geranylgeranyl reductase family protein